MCAANYSVFTFHTSLNLTSPEGGIERMRGGGGGEDAMCEATGNDHIMQRKKFAIFYVHGPKSIIFSSFSCTSTIAMFSVGSFLSCYEVLDTSVMGTPPNVMCGSLHCEHENLSSLDGLSSSTRYK